MCSRKAAVKQTCAATPGVNGTDVAEADVVYEIMSAVARAVDRRGTAESRDVGVHLATGPLDGCVCVCVCGPGPRFGRTFGGDG